MELFTKPANNSAVILTTDSSITTTPSLLTQVEPNVLAQGGNIVCLIWATAVLIQSIAKLIEVLIPVMVKKR